MTNSIKKELQKYASPQKALVSRRFFKTGKGEYGEGDVFIGVTITDVRRVAKTFVKAAAETLQCNISALLQSKIHEERQCALEMLVMCYETGDSRTKNQIARFYLGHLAGVNNWDLVDGSASYILGHWLHGKNKNILYRLARSKNLWERRIAIIATFYFIKKNQFSDTLKISDILLKDNHDLIHKAVGWMLREVGNRNREVEEQFLKQFYKQMPRTMLRYAVEKFPEKLRRRYLKKTQ